MPSVRPPTPLQLARSLKWLHSVKSLHRDPARDHAENLWREIKFLQRQAKTKEERLLLRAIKIWYEVQKLPPDSDDAYGLKGALDDLIRRAQLLYSLTPKAVGGRNSAWNRVGRR